MATSEYTPRPGETADQISMLTASASERGRSHFRLGAVSALLLMLKDVAAILVAFCFVLAVPALSPDRTFLGLNFRHATFSAPLGFSYLTWFIATYLITVRRYGLYGSIPKINSIHELRMTVQACLIAGLLLCSALYITDNWRISRTLVLLLVGGATILLCGRRILWEQSRRSALVIRNVAIVGTNPLSYALGEQIANNSRLGYALRGYIATDATEEKNRGQILGSLDEIHRLTRKHFVDEIVITELCPTTRVVQLIDQMRDLKVDVRSILGYCKDLTTEKGVEYLGVFPLTSLHRSVSRGLARSLKRVGDILLSFTALVLASPILLLVALAIRLDSEGPVIYISQRIGRRGEVFRCYKFRTMVKNADQLQSGLHERNERNRVLFKVSNDPRLTRIGRILRKYSLDELPQFINILRGEMSLVGPRPPTLKEVEQYDLNHLRRLEVLPGLTGLWQVKARQDSSFERYIALDTAYVENWGFWLDLTIMVRTVGAVLRGTGT